jgi:hypothetical protein
MLTGSSSAYNDSGGLWPMVPKHYFLWLISRTASGVMSSLQWSASETVVGLHDLAAFQESSSPVTNLTSAIYASLTVLLMLTLTLP